MEDVRLHRVNVQGTSDALWASSNPSERFRVLRGIRGACFRGNRYFLFSKRGLRAGCQGRLQPWALCGAEYVCPLCNNGLNQAMRKRLRRKRRTLSSESSRQHGSKKSHAVMVRTRVIIIESIRKYPLPHMPPLSLVSPDSTRSVRALPRCVEAHQVLPLSARVK